VRFVAADTAGRGCVMRAQERRKAGRRRRGVFGVASHFCFTRRTRKTVSPSSAQQRPGAAARPLPAPAPLRAG
jgi:hypothetical protein